VWRQAAEAWRTVATSIGSYRQWRIKAWYHQRQQTGKIAAIAAALYQRMTRNGSSG